MSARAHRAALLGASAFALALSGAPSLASADVSLDATLQREWSLPLGFDPFSASLGSNRDGLVWLAATSGVEAASTCVVVVADSARARSFQLRPREIPSECVGVEVSASGEIFARLSDPTVAPGLVRGVTVGVDPDGAIAWEVYDDDLVDADATADGGTGAFQGTYDAPVAPVAWSPGLGRLLAFTGAALELGQTAQPLTNGHVYDTTRDALAVSGLGFGASGLGVVTQATVRPEDGRFILSVAPQSALDDEYAFVSYDGRRDLERIDPLSPGAFRGRVPLALTAAPGQRLHILWAEGPVAEADAGLTTVDPAGRGFLDVDLPQSRLVDGEVVALGRPLGIWTDDALAWILYSIDGAPFVRVVTLDEGEDWGLVPLGSATRQIPLGLAYVAPGQVGLITREVGGGVSAWTLTASDLEDAPSTGAESSSDAGFDPDGGIPPIEVPDAADVLCGCRQSPGAPAPLPGALALFGLLGWARRRR